jgi:hypothetical protein
MMHYAFLIISMVVGVAMFALADNAIEKKSKGWLLTVISAVIVLVGSIIFAVLNIMALFGLI